jgi:hypothetical protein
MRMIQLDTIGCLVGIMVLVMIMMLMGVAVRLLFSPLGVLLMLFLAGKLLYDAHRYKSVSNEPKVEIKSKGDPSADREQGSYDRDAEDVDYKPLDR